MRSCSRIVPGVIALAIGGTAAASDVIVEWSGLFEIPDIIDPPGVFIELEVGSDPGGMNIITDVDLAMIIPCTWQGDLIIALEHVDTGSFHTLLDRPGSPEAGTYGFSADNYGNSKTGEFFVLDDEAANPYDVPFVESPGIPDVVGSWQPDSDPLSSFDGESIVGSWRIWFADQGAGDQAYVENLELRFTTVPAPASMALMAAGMIGCRRRRRT